MQPVHYWDDLLHTLENRHTYLDLAAHVAILLFIWLLASLVVRLGRAAIRRSMQPLVDSDLRHERPTEAARHRTLIGLSISLLRYSVYFIALIAALATWNVRFLGLLGTAMGTAGILGVVVGFGAQKLVRDVITGFFILMEDQYSVGDTVTIGTVTGVVDDIGIRVTRIRDDVGRLNMIPNGDISQVTNHSRGRLSAAVEVGVSPDQDLQAASEAVARAGARACDAASGVIVGDAAVEGITTMDGTRVSLRIAAPAAPGQQKAAEMALRAAIREEFLAAGIKIV